MTGGFRQMILYEVHIIQTYNYSFEIEKFEQITKSYYSWTKKI